MSANNRKYLVSWKIDAEAQSVLYAALEARSMQASQQSTATVFEVLDIASGQRFTVDLHHMAVEAIPEYLTREEAHELITETHAGGDSQLLCLTELAEHWGMQHIEGYTDADSLAQALHELVDEHANELEGRQPHPTDPTDLTAPQE